MVSVFVSQELMESDVIDVLRIIMNSQPMVASELEKHQISIQLINDKKNFRIFQTMRMLGCGKLQ